jgi:cobalt-precorrin-5B (C1)-methyltransferase
MSLRTGITTGTCAAAAARAAATVLAGLAPPAEVPVELPDGRTIVVPVLRTGVSRSSPPLSASPRPRVPASSSQGEGEISAPTATAAVRKDAGDDPDVTDGLEIVATVSWNDGGEVTFSAGEGVGTVTKPGLQVPPGEPAINPVPRRMIVAAVRQVTSRGLHVEIAIPGGRQIAARTFNPRLGIAQGLSILGTTGIVRPYCTRALHDALRCAVDVAAACGQTAPVLVPGAIGARAARARFVLGDQQLIEVGNAWGFVLDLLPRHPWRALMLVGHPGKLAKLAAGQWDTHSRRSDSPTRLLADLAQQLSSRHADLGSVSPFAAPAWPPGLTAATGVSSGGHDVSSGGRDVSPGGHAGSADSPTTEGIFAALDDRRRKELGDALAGRIRQVVADRLQAAFPLAVLLVDMSGQTLGCDGDLSPWQ